MLETLLQNNKKLSSKPTTLNFFFYRINQYLSPVRARLEKQLDKRLVKTFGELFVVILMLRDCKNGLLLSLLGDYLSGYAHGPAGTKRIGNLLRSKKWMSSLIDDFFLAKAKVHVEKLKSMGKRVLIILDESCIEKPDSWRLSDLCSVVSSKGKQLLRIRPGFYQPVVRRICVAGFQWTACLISALGEVPMVGLMSWWTSRGKRKQDAKQIFVNMLAQLHRYLGPGLLFVLDRGYASAWCIGQLIAYEQDFLIRWKQNINLIHAVKGQKQTHLLARSIRAMGSKLVYDKERKILRCITIAYSAVVHPDFADQTLYLIIVRAKRGARRAYQSPMYLLTSIQIDSLKTAWEMCHSYMSRWNIEQTFRVCKAELGMESPRLWDWDNRLKMLAIVALVYDFLLSMLRCWPAWVKYFVRNYCHRTGNKLQQSQLAIYRLRIASTHFLLRPIWYPPPLIHTPWARHREGLTKKIAAKKPTGQ